MMGLLEKFIILPVVICAVTSRSE